MHRTKIPTMKVILFRNLKKAIKQEVWLEKEQIDAGNFGIFRHDITLEQGKIKGILSVAYDMEYHYKGLGERLEHVSFYLRHREWRKHKEQK